MWRSLSLSEKKKFWAFIEPFLTDSRKELFDQLLSERTRHITIAVEDVFHEHNSGALIRTAECFGVQDIHIMEDENKFKVMRGMAKGSEKWVSINYYKGKEGVHDCVNGLKNEGYTIVAATPHEKEVLLPEYVPNQKTAFFFGSEKTGVRPEILNAADYHLRIPIYGATESFNVSVSAALILQNMRNKLNNMEKPDWELSPAEKLDLRIEWALRGLRKSKLLLNKFLSEH